MKSPTNINGNNLAAFLQNTTEFLMAELYTITLVDGTVLRYTSFDNSLTVLGNAFVSGTPQFTRTQVEEKIGLEVSEIKVSVYSLPTDLINGVPALQKIARGDFDYATIKVERLYMDSNQNQIGTVVRFYGILGDVSDLGRTSATVTAKSYVEQLTTLQLPRNILQSPCKNTLFDSACSLLASSFAVNSSVGANSTTLVINCSLAQANGYFSQGRIVFTSGANNGATRAVKLYVPGQITLAAPLFHAPGAGDTFTIYPGCDKQQSTCQGKFNNLGNFGGFPYVPQPETAI